MQRLNLQTTLTDVDTNEVLLDSVLSMHFVPPGLFGLDLVMDKVGRSRSDWKMCQPKLDDMTLLPTLWLTVTRLRLTGGSMVKRMCPLFNTLC